MFILPIGSMVCIHEWLDRIDPRECQPLRLGLEPATTKKKEGVWKEEKQKIKDGKDSQSNVTWLFKI